MAKGANESVLMLLAGAVEMAYDISGPIVYFWGISLFGRLLRQRLNWATNQDNARRPRW